MEEAETDHKVGPGQRRCEGSEGEEGYEGFEDCPGEACIGECLQRSQGEIKTLGLRELVVAFLSDEAGSQSRDRETNGSEMKICDLKPFLTRSLAWSLKIQALGTSMMGSCFLRTQSLAAVYFEVVRAIQCLVVAT